MNDTASVPTSFVAWILGGVATAFSTVTGALLGIVWKKHNQEIRDIKDTMETNRKEMRDAVVLVHQKVESIDREAQHRHLEIMRVLLERK